MENKIAKLAQKRKKGCFDRWCKLELKQLKKSINCFSHLSSKGVKYSCFSSSHVIINWISLGFWLLLGLHWACFACFLLLYISILTLMPQWKPSAPVNSSESSCTSWPQWRSSAVSTAVCSAVHTSHLLSREQKSFRTVWRKNPISRWRAPGCGLLCNVVLH